MRFIVKVVTPLNCFCALAAGSNMRPMTMNATHRPRKAVRTIADPWKSSTNAIKGSKVASLPLHLSHPRGKGEGAHNKMLRQLPWSTLTRLKGRGLGNRNGGSENGDEPRQGDKTQVG